MPPRGHQPDAGLRRQVEALAGYGVPETEIAGLMVGHWVQGKIP